jgi:hypothetical protein
MAQKLYIDGLRFLAGKSHKYSTRYQAQLAANLTGDQYTALIEFIACVANLLAKLGPNVITPTP